MNRLSKQGRQWLISFHILFSGAWVGAGFGLILLLLASSPANGDELHGVLASARLIDDFIIIPVAMGSLITGALISWLTSWGFFTFKWVTIKWILTVASIIFGTFWLGPWLNGMEELSAVERALALDNPTSLHYRLMLTISSPIQVGSLVFMVFLSVFKPWKKWKH